MHLSPAPPRGAGMGALDYFGDAAMNDTKSWRCHMRPSSHLCLKPQGTTATALRAEGSGHVGSGMEEESREAPHAHCRQHLENPTDKRAATF